MTGLVVESFLLDPAIDETDPAVAAAIKYILNTQQPDGGIYDKVLPSYNTAICLSALAHVKHPDARVKEAIAKAQVFLKGIQHGEGAARHEGLSDAGEQVTKDDPAYGGWGYGRSGRPDLSNTAFVLEALHDSGVEPTDPAFQRALIFLQRTQMVEEFRGVKVNDMPYAKGSTQGGFIYATSENKDKPGSGQSMAGTIEETLSDGTKASRLRSYGSMTYSGFKSYLYAHLPKDDPRVEAALGWIGRNYTLAENPGLGKDGMYYYFVVFSRALAANGRPTIATTDASGATTERRWGDDLRVRLAELQQEDGSFKVLSPDARWLESDPVLVTAYALIALEHAK